MNWLIILVVVVLLVGGGGYFGGGPTYPYRGYAMPGVGALILVVVLLYVLGIIR